MSDGIIEHVRRGHLSASKNMRKNGVTSSDLHTLPVRVRIGLLIWDNSTYSVE
jgi:hypothetical protein